MPSKFQFDTVCKLLNSGISNYVTLRQQAGLTAEELDDILKNMEYYSRKFAAEEMNRKMMETKNAMKKPWWKR